MTPEARSHLRRALGAADEFRSEQRAFRSSAPGVRRHWQVHAFLISRAIARHVVSSAATGWIRSCSEETLGWSSGRQDEWRSGPMFEAILGPLDATFDAFAEAQVSAQRLVERLSSSEVLEHVTSLVLEADWVERSRWGVWAMSLDAPLLMADDVLRLEMLVYDRALLRLVCAELDQTLGRGSAGRLAAGVDLDPIRRLDEALVGASERHPVVRETTTWLEQELFLLEPLAEEIARVVPAQEHGAARARASSLDGAWRTAGHVLSRDKLPWHGAGGPWI